MNKKMLIAGLFALFASTSALASTWYVNVDTSSLAGQTGWLDFQFNPGDVTAPSATATVAAFATSGGTLLPSATPTGDVSGSLNSAMTLGNSQYFNDLLQAFTFGTKLSFSINLDLPHPSLDPAAPGTAFGLSFYDTAYNSLLADPDWGAALVMNLKGDGATEVLAKSAPVSLSATAPTSVPLPGALGLLFAGISMLAGLARTRFYRG
ncbi:hypothetical protein SCT_2622 [Sulfuricella sp. T08]|uniref:NF038129 family PEP-CTERM protein n=1 Tax=Sulfuricella sp. T08 TaxID=1632857 RepID=UPI000617968E|nr:NF038129 family PEP-CTERM protein [Sulfuricella sp. T08]GAO37204.1 hypothetical protein SCT_2622 [Sulfuricella sp. T08]